MIVRTKHGARMSFFSGPQLHDGPRATAGVGSVDDNELINKFLQTPGKKAAAIVDEGTCERCKKKALSKLMRSTPLKGILCPQCLTSLGSKCFLSGV